MAAVGDPVRPRVFYFGAAAGGVWKTEDAGSTWENVTDGQVTSASVGALAVAPSDPSVVYAGMGESCIRGNVVAGDGVWRSPDGGVTWQNRGLRESQHIARIRVHPLDADLVYAAVFGHVYDRSEERGVYRSRDGGKTWERILYRNDHTGAIDLVMDPERPNLLYATLWDAHRTPHSLVSGGEGSGVYRSRDAGDTWEELTDRPGLPRGLKGRMGVALSPRPGRLWLMVEALDGGLFRSDDWGEHWRLMNDHPDLRQRPWYYMHIFADPSDADTVWALNLRVHRSRDGGKSFEQVPTPHGDNHDLWIDPKNPLRMIEANDGGVNITFDGGRTWTLPTNQPTGQFYHVVTDREFPYRIYGAQQDNSTIRLPSLSPKGYISAGDTAIVGGGESGYIAVRPDRPNIVYAGSYASRMTRHDSLTGQDVDITVWPEDPIGYGAGALRYRFQWTFPIVLSPHDPNVLYACGNVVFRSRDGGDSWDPVSPDLTRADPSTLEPSGGPITKDNVSTETYGTIFAFAESPVEPGVLWAGSDDGLIHVSRDGGRNWRNVTPKASLLPEWALVSIIEPSRHRAGSAYVAATRYKSGDRRPYLFRTEDYGESWFSIVTGLPEDDFTRVIREDPEEPRLLYAGTESGVYISLEDGECWYRLGGRLPVTSMHDLTVHGSDLIVATHGRGFWVLDDLTPYRELKRQTGSDGSEGIGVEGLRLFTPRPAYRMKAATNVPGGKSGGFQPFRQAGGEMVRVREVDGRARPVDAGENPMTGAVFIYWLSHPVGPGGITIRVLNDRGDVVRTARSTDPSGWGSTFPVGAGVHRVEWDLRVESGTELKGNMISAYWGGSTVGPKVPPGVYRVVVETEDRTASAPFEVRKDPRFTSVSEADLKAQYELLLAIRDKLTEIHEAIGASQAVRDSLRTYARRLAEAGEEALAERASALSERILEIESELYEPRARGGADAFNYPPKVNSKIASLESTVSYGDARPPRQTYEVFALLREVADGHLRALRKICREDLANLNREIALSQVAPVEIPQGLGFQVPEPMNA